MSYAERAQNWAKGKNTVKVEVYDWERLQKEGMGGLINVGKGSSRKPCMVIFTINPNVDPKAQCLVLLEKELPSTQEVFRSSQEHQWTK